MSVGLIGAAGVGKSTLARAYAEKHGWGFVPSPGSACFKELGLPYVGLTFDERMKVQWLILMRMDEALGVMRGPWISDRTPLDAAAYVLAEWGQRCDAEGGREILEYVAACYRVLNRHFSMAVLVQPGIPYADDGSRPPENAAAQEMHNMLCGDLLRSERCGPQPFMLMRCNTDRATRMEGLGQLWAMHLRMSAELLVGQTVH